MPGGITKRTICVKAANEISASTTTYVVAGPALVFAIGMSSSAASTVDLVDAATPGTTPVKWAIRTTTNAAYSSQVFDPPLKMATGLCIIAAASTKAYVTYLEL